MSGIEFNINKQNIAVLRVNRPAVRNALDWDAMEEFAKAVEDAHNSPKLQALIVTGTGESFVSGGDLKSLHNTFSTRGPIKRSGFKQATQYEHLEILNIQLL